MGVDNETVPRWINVVLDNKPAYLKLLSEQAQEDGQNDDGAKKLSLTQETHSLTCEEFYYEERENELNITFSAYSTKGESFVSVCIPLSDTVLIDILQGGIKKLNKLKNAMESLK